MMRAFIFSVGLAAASACTPAEQPQAPPQAAQETVVAPTEWLDADGVSATAVIYREKGLDLFSLTCLGESKQLVASATVMLEMPAPEGQQASVFLGTDEFKGKTTLVEVTGHTVAVSTPVTADLLSALASAETIQVVLGEASAEGGPGAGAAMKRLATNCGLITGLSTPSP